MNFEEAFKDELGKNAGAWDKVKGAASSSVEAVKGAAKSVAGKVAGGAGALAGRAAGASPSFKAGVAKGFQASLPKYSWQK